MEGGYGEGEGGGRGIGGIWEGVQIEMSHHPSFRHLWEYPLCR